MARGRYAPPKANNQIPRPCANPPPPRYKHTPCSGLPNQVLQPAAHGPEVGMIGHYQARVACKEQYPVLSLGGAGVAVGSVWCHAVLFPLMACPDAFFQKTICQLTAYTKWSAHYDRL